MGYIYTVKPLKEVIKIAVEHDDFTVNNAGNAFIYGIDVVYWPADAQVKSAERITKGYVKLKGYALPTRYLTEEYETDDPPKFIIDLYKAMDADCHDVKCQYCPLSHLPDLCGNVIDAMRKRWGFKDDTGRI